MNLRPLARCFFILAAAPLGAVAGFPCGYFATLGVLRLEGKGNSHEDIYTLVSAGPLGAVVGVILFPIATWVLTRQRRNKRHPD
jgi:hypothetical protein